MIRWVACGATVFVLLCGLRHAPSPAAAAPAATPTPDPRAWPSTYQPSDITLEALLAPEHAADDRSSNHDTLRISYAVHSEGLDGSRTDIVRGDDYRTIFSLGPTTSQSGRRNGRQWEQDENGYTRFNHGYHHQVDADEFAREAGDPATVHLAGRISSPCQCYAVLIGPEASPRERDFYDATRRLIRIEFKGLGRLVVASFDDYRVINGIGFPWRTSISDGRVANDEVYTVTALESGGPVSDQDLAAPASRSPLFFPANTDRVRLPVRIEHGRIIVRVDINGPGLDFQLDSGADGILIDRNNAAQLNLETFGHRAEQTAGPYTSSTVIIRRVWIGGVGLEKVVATAAPFHWHHDFDTEIVGLLGYDFIAGCTLRVDYAAGTVDALRPGTYRAPVGAVILDAALDDGVPAVTMVVDGAIGQHFVLDTGADEVMIFPGFANANPEAVKDTSKFQMISHDFNFVVAEGVGGAIALHLVLLPDLFFGNVHFQNQIVPVLYGGQKSFEGEDLDGLVGSPLLRAFTVTFDYDNDHVILEPGPLVRRGP